MSVIYLDRPWIHEAANMANNDRFYTGAPDETRVRPGEVREYGDRQRVVTYGVRSRPVAVSLVDVTLEQLDWLDGLAGEIVMYRDRYRLLFGTFFELHPEEYRDVNFAVSLALVPATFDITV